MVLQAKRVLTARKVKALSFDGVNDHVNVTNTTISSISTEITIVTIVKLGTVSSTSLQVLVGFWYGYYLGVAGGKYEIHVITSTGAGIGTRAATPKFEVNPKEYHIVTGEYDGEYLKNHVDGKLYRERYVGNIVLKSPPLCSVGYNSATNGGYVNGNIPMVLIYNRALSEDEHKQLAKNPYHPPLSGCVLWLSAESIDESAGVWRDQSGNGNNGTIYGAQAIEMNKLAFSVKSPSRVLGVV